MLNWLINKQPSYNNSAILEQQKLKVLIELVPLSSLQEIPACRRNH